MCSNRLIARKRGFTLVEIMVCLALLVSLGGFFVFQSKKMMDAYQFKTSSSSFVQEILLTKHLAMLYHIDIDLRLSKKKGVFFLQRESTEPPSYEAHQFKKETKLTKISSITYLGEPLDNFLFSFDENGLIEREQKGSGFLKKEERKIILHPQASSQEEPVSIRIDKL